jgi:flagellar hook protein FlgE
MIRSLITALSGMKNFQQRMDVIGNNVANVNTTGYKAARTDFADSFNQVLRSSSATNGGENGSGSIQIGTGVATTAVKDIHTQGSIARTGVQTDLAATGNGYFTVRDSLNGSEFVTRSGNFRLDDNGYLVTNTGQRVQGYTNSSLNALGDIQIDAAGKPGSADPDARLVSYSFARDGQINVQLSDGTQFTRGQVLLQKFRDPQALSKEGNNLYSNMAAAGPLGGANTPTPAAPGSNGLGTSETGALELSNVDLANEFSDLITTQRSFQASARMITTSDEMIQEVVNLKR